MFQIWQYRNNRILFAVIVTFKDVDAAFIVFFDMVFIPLDNADCAQFKSVLLGGDIFIFTFAFDF